jgi:hypothetical protein
MMLPSLENFKEEQQKTWMLGSESGFLSYEYGCKRGRYRIPWTTSTGKKA